MGIYIDTGFHDLLERRIGAGGDFARYYVMAHEYGHHIQNLTGLAARIRAAQQRNPSAANELQVRMELQADCYAGVWAGKNRQLIETCDIEEGLRAAGAMGMIPYSARQADVSILKASPMEQVPSASRRFVLVFKPLIASNATHILRCSLQA